MPEATFDPAVFFVEPQRLGSYGARISVYVPCSYDISQPGLAGADWLSADSLYDADSEDKANHPPKLGVWVFDSLSWVGYGKHSCKASLRFSYPRGRKVPPEAEVIKLVSDLLPDLTRRVSEYREAMARRCAESKAAQERRTAEQARASLIAAGVKQARQEIMRLAREKIGLDAAFTKLRQDMEAAVRDLLDNHPEQSMVAPQDIFSDVVLDMDYARDVADEINAQVKGDIGKMVKLWDNPLG